MVQPMKEAKTLTLSQVLGAAGICPEPLVEKWLADREASAPRFEAAAKAGNTLRYNGPFMRQSEFSAALDAEYGIQSASAASTQRVLDAADGGEFTALINSGGGDYDEFVAIRTLWNAYRKAHETKINSVAIGATYSAAAFLFMAGDRREIDPLATLMFHKVRAWGGGTDADHRNIASSLEARDASVSEWLAGKTKMKADDYRAKVEAGDWYVSADEAVELGIATGLYSAETADDEAGDETEARADAPLPVASSAHLLFALRHRAPVHHTTITAGR